MGMRIFDREACFRLVPAVGWGVAAVATATAAAAAAARHIAAASGRLTHQFFTRSEPVVVTRPNAVCRRQSTGELKSRRYRFCVRAASISTDVYWLLICGLRAADPRVYTSDRRMRKVLNFRDNAEGLTVIYRGEFRGTRGR
jgi:hypothetical protein